MNVRKNYVDAHCHLTDRRIDNVTDTIERSRQLGIHLFIQGGVSPDEWQRQVDLHKKFSDNILMSFGLHPWFVAAEDEPSCELAFSRLERELYLASACGELGLDYGRRCPPESFDRQKVYFKRQLALALLTKKPLVIHCVSAHDDLFSILTETAPLWTGIVHSFSGTFLDAEKYLNLGLLISLGGPLVTRENLQKIAKLLPLEKIVLESDSPDQAPPPFASGKNEPHSILEVAQVLAELKELSTQKVLEITSANARRVFSR